MVLDKINKTNVFQRLRNLVLGSEKPNLLVRFSVIGGLFIWLYFFSWHLITFLSLALLDNLKQAPNVRAAYGRIGYQYHYTDTINRLTLYSAAELILYLVVFVALILIYRKKRVGIILYLITTILTLTVTFFVMGLAFMINEISLFEYILIIASFAYFAFGFVLFYRKPKELTSA